MKNVRLFFRLRHCTTRNNAHINAASTVHQHDDRRQFSSFRHDGAAYRLFSGCLETTFGVASPARRLDGFG